MDNECFNNLNITFLYKRMKLPICALLICKDCKHFMGDTQECRKYKHTDIVTGKITYDDARFARRTLCGEE